MTNNKTSFCLYFFLMNLFFTVFSSVYGQSSDKTQKVILYDTSVVSVRMPAPEKLASFREDDDFTYDRTPVRISVWDPIINWFKRMLSILLFHSRYSGDVWEIFFYALFIFSVVFIILRLTNTEFRSLFRQNDKSDKLEFHVLEENIQEMDFDQLIEKAIEQKKYRIAIRYHYLRTLRALSDRNIIQWKLEKTNYDYILEIKNNDIRRSFLNITDLFEYAWYGDFPIDHPSFQEIKGSFTQFNLLLQKHSQ